MVLSNGQLVKIWMQCSSYKANNKTFAILRFFNIRINRRKHMYSLNDSLQNNSSISSYFFDLGHYYKKYLHLHSLKMLNRLLILSSKKLKHIKWK
jgi:hypothetical protein